MTQFIESFATQQLLPPWKSEDVAMWVLALPLPNDRGIAGFLDDYLNGTGEVADGSLAPAPFLYRPLPGPQFGFLVVADHPGAVSVADNAYLQYGSKEAGWNRIKNILIYLAVPVMRHRVSPTNLLLDGDVVWIQPFAGCDSSSVVFSAREIWGADIWQVRIDRDPDVAAPALHIDAAYIGCEPFSPFSFNELLAALHLKVGDGAPADADALARVDPHLLNLVSQLVGIGANPGGAPGGEGQPAGSIEFDSLKQLRAAEDMRFAVYRALVAARQTHAAARGLMVHDVADVEVDFMWSEALAQLQADLLGLKPTLGSGPPPPHPPVRPPPPSSPGQAPNQIRWDLDRNPAQVALCLSFTTDLYFEVLSTLHVYRPLQT